MVEVGTATKLDISKLGFSMDFPLKIKIHFEWSVITLILALPVHLGTLKYKVLVMRIEMGLSTDFSHSSEYHAAINATKKAPNLLCSIAKRQCFRAKGKGACAHRACACYETALCCLSATSLPLTAQAQSSVKDGKRYAQLFLHSKQQDLRGKGRLIYWVLTLSR